MQYQYTPSDIQRFNNKIKIAPSGCHEWQASLNNSGYGQFRVGGKMMLAHRVAWEMANGQIPDGLMCLHACDRRSCTNVAHLWLGTQKDNIRDCVAKGRANKVKGERHGSAKLTEKDVIEIREMYASGGRTQVQLASVYQVAQQRISLIVRRKIWKHIQDGL